MSVPDHAVVDPDWLALREPADTRARDLARGLLLPPLLAQLSATATADPLRVVDLGAGTGANLRWLSPRLSAAAAGQRWTLVDHDPRLTPWGPVPFALVHGDVLDLPDLLQRAGGVDLFTAAALLDIFDPPRLRAVVQAAVQAQAPALFALTVTGEVRMDPADPRDEAVAEAFDAHQQRGAKPGPQAGRAVAELFDRAGWRVLTVATPWRLAADREPDLVGSWLAGRAEAATEQRPDRAVLTAGWLERRRSQTRQGALTAEVGHLDLLALPPVHAAP